MAGAAVYCETCRCKGGHAFNHKFLFVVVYQYKNVVAVCNDIFRRQFRKRKGHNVGPASAAPAVAELFHIFVGKILN